MPREVSFRRNVALISVAHVAVLLGLTRWSGESKKPVTADVVWMDGGAAALAAAAVVQTPDPMIAAIPQREPPAVEEEPGPVLKESEIAPPIPTIPATPKPAPSPTDPPKPSPIRKASPSATPKASPKPTPKVTASPSPKKTLLAKASPSPKATASPKNEASPTGDAQAVTKEVTGASVSAGKSPGTGGTSTGGGAGAASQFSWYGNMLHDRFFKEWVQPKTALATGSRMSALVKVRIEKDGRVSDFAIVRSSGNVVVDESVSAVARRVIRVDPLPAGLAGDGHYDVNINFELNVEE